MSKYLYKLLFIALILGLSGCEKNRNEEPDDPYANADYYVKYEAKVTSNHTGTVVYYVSTEDDGMTFNSGNSFSKTFGPFKKGGWAYIEVDASNISSATCMASIYVCRGSEPFTLKATKTGGKKLVLEYTIDY